MNTRTFARIFTSLFAFAMVLGMFSAQGAPVLRIWDGDTSVYWGDVANWDGAPINGDHLTFPTGAPNKSNVNSLNPTGTFLTSIGNLTLEDAGWDIDLGASAFTIVNITATGSSKLTGNVVMTNGSPRTITLDGTNSTLTLDGVLNLARANNTMTLNVNGAGNTLVLGGLALTGDNAPRTISGTGNVTVIGGVTNGKTTVYLNLSSTGTLTLNGVNTYVSATTITNGTLIVNGSITTSPITIKGGTLGGSGSVSSNVIVDAAATAAVLAPGASIGSLEVGGALTLTAASHVNIDIGGAGFVLNTAEDHDRVKVAGPTNLGGAELHLSFANGFTPANGDLFGIVDAAGGLSGTFAGLPEGALVWSQNKTSVYITYAGLVDASSVAMTGGNDVVLYTVTIPEPSADVSTVAASPTSIPADGAATATITVTIMDAAGTALAGREVALANTGGPGMADISPAGPVTTDANGVATFTVSSATVGIEVFTATDLTDVPGTVITQTASVGFTTTIPPPTTTSQTSLIPGYTPPPPPPPDAPQTSLAGTTNPPPPESQSAPQDTSGDTADPVDDTAPDVIRVTEYYLTTGDFAGTTATLTLDQDLAADYFILVRGSRAGNGLSMPDSDYARVAAVPGGGGGLADAGAADRIGLRRAAAEFDWEGVVTVVECLAPDSPAGFRLVDAVVATLSGATGSLACAPWSDTTRVVPFGGYRGGGVELPDSPANRYQGTSAYVRLAPGASGTLEWVRDGGGEALSDAVMTTFVVEWGAGWTVQHAAVVGSAGGDGADAAGEYTTAAIAPVARANTWVWGTGIRADAGIGDCAESCLVTLGDGVNLNAAESTVAVGSEYTDAYSFDVYALTHPALAVDHRFKPDGDLKGLDIPVAVATAAPGARFAWLYNGCNGTSSRFPRPRMWSHYTAAETITISRGYDGAAFPAWIQGIDFSGLAD